MTSLSNGLYRPEPEEALHLITLPLETFAPEEQSAPKMTEEALQENSGIREEVQSEPKKEPEQEERRPATGAECCTVCTAAGWTAKVLLWRCLIILTAMRQV